MKHLPSPPKSHAEVSSMDLKGNLSTKNYRDIFWEMLKSWYWWRYMGQIMQKQIGQIGQKANWANCFFQCVQGMLRIISIIYIIINIIFILYLLLTWKSRCAYMKMPNLLLPNLPNLPTNSGLSSTRQWRGSWWYRSIWKKRSHSGVIAELHRRENLLKYWKNEILKNVTKPWTCASKP